jgi:voltage-gated potassium channel
MLDSVQEIAHEYRPILVRIEWLLTALFTVEYTLRLWCVDRPLRYAGSFFGMVDLLSILPAYLGLFVNGTESLMVVRALRLLRVFRVLKLGNLMGEANVLRRAIAQSRGKISVFLASVLILTVIAGSVMYLVEGPANGFTSIPRGVYWAIVTMTTVGYGDIHPRTPLGQFFAATLMVMGYAIIAVPTGIVSVELAEAQRREKVEHMRTCAQCGVTGLKTQRQRRTQRPQALMAQRRLCLVNHSRPPCPLLQLPQPRLIRRFVLKPNVGPMFVVLNSRALICPRAQSKLHVPHKPTIHDHHVHV